VIRKLLLSFAAVATLAGCASPLGWTSSSTPQQAVAHSTAASASYVGVYNSSISTGSGMLTGAYEGDAPHSWSGMSEFASETGTKPQIAVYYSDWKTGFNTAFAQTARSNGAYVYVQLQPTGVTLASIADGDWDYYLRNYATSVRDFGHPVIFSFAHEMNGNWYSWGQGHQSPADFVAAWRHIVQVFRNTGASNALWVWAVNAVNIGDHQPLSQWWPGSEWVNWVGIDGYYYFDWDTYATVFGTTIAQIRTFSDAPIMIAETAVGTTSDRESQITALVAGARADHVVALVWFDVTQDDGVYHQDWRLEDDDFALEAYKAALGS
jgi:hypothetical protein